MKVVKALCAQPLNKKVSINAKGKEVTPQGAIEIFAYVIENKGKKVTLLKDDAVNYVRVETAKALLGLKGDEEPTREALEKLPADKLALIGVIDNAKIGNRGTKYHLAGLKGKSFFAQGIVECVFKTEVVEKEITDKKTKEKRKEKVEQVAVDKDGNRIVAKKEYEEIAKKAPKKAPKKVLTDEEKAEKEKKQSPATTKKLLGLFK